MKKSVFLMIIAAILFCSLKSQELIIHRTNGAIVPIPIETIDSITFPGFGIGTGMPCPGTPTVTDVDGNEYNTVLIGDQCWMKENLKTTKYRNGNDIEYPGSDNTEWRDNDNGAYAWYSNDPGWGDYYGALYNWLAVNNSSGLCPVGWHVPSDSEWEMLIGFIQGIEPEDIGNQLKSCRQVNSPLGGDCTTGLHPRWDSDSQDYGTDDYGFSALPGGYRSIYGGYDNIGESGFWWSNTESSSSGSWERHIYYSSGNVNRDAEDKNRGYSVRCIKN